jgi:hypothetical protein
MALGLLPVENHLGARTLCIVLCYGVSDSAE